MTTVDLTKIKSLRIKNKMSQDDMANLLGFNTKFPYHRKEIGKQDFTALELQTIANHFKQPMEVFFTSSVAENAINQEVC
ncbi:helix-turn-helix transcriptional regulator [Terribacillus sp. JSM ZJ617]|uniref:helix-turn-helix transcriptional regulator n=1 Tax=Terribacillus sp. JSM ZJ617 TaxID=3342119 RepID=UPI0035A8F1C7